MFKDKNLLLYLIGTATTIFGDAISMIALPWYVLEMTGEPSMLGLILALEGVPRAVFMLYGGALADKISPRKLLFYTRGISIFSVGGLGLLILTGTMQEWMIYPFAIIFGTVGAFHIPAATAILPTLVQGDALRPANAVVSGVTQLSMILGPAIAGILIATLTIEGSFTGIGYAFLLDSLTFLIGAFTLFLVKTKYHSDDEDHEEGLLIKLKKGLKYAFGVIELRTIIIYIAVANFFGVGVIIIGLPVYAQTSLGLGVEGFGYLMSGFGGGALIGTILSGVLPIKSHNKGVILFVLAAISGIGIGILPNLGSGYVPIAFTVLIGIISGYTNIFFITWIQQIVDVKLIGRVMSIITFASVALIPISSAIAGFGIEIFGLVFMMGLGGVLMAICALTCLIVPEIRVMAIPEKKQEDDKLPEETPAE